MESGAGAKVFFNVKIGNYAYVGNICVVVEYIPDYVTIVLQKFRIIIKDKMSNINVLEIVPHFPFVRSFIGKRADYMCEHGINIHVICNKHPDIESYEKEHKFPIKAITFDRKLSLIKDIKAFLQIRKYIKYCHIDIIIGHMIKGQLMAAILGIILNKKVVIWAHGTTFETSSFLKKKLLISLDKFVSYHSQEIICVSQFVAEIRQMYKIDEPNKQFIPGHGSCTGIDCDIKYNPHLIDDLEKNKLKESLHISKDDIIIGFCGRIRRDKGIEELVKAFNIIRYKKKNIKLLLVGDNDIRDNINPQVQSMIEKDESIIKTGYIKENIQLYYSIMDVFVLPTHRDGFGMCLIEAAALGIPVLTTKITGSRDAISEGYNGLYIDLNPEDIANRILIILNNVFLQNKFKVNGKKWVSSNFKQRDIFEILTKEYKRFYSLNVK